MNNSDSLKKQIIVYDILTGVMLLCIAVLFYQAYRLLFRYYTYDLTSGLLFLGAAAVCAVITWFLIRRDTKDVFRTITETEKEYERSFDDDQFTRLSETVYAGEHWLMKKSGFSVNAWVRECVTDIRRNEGAEEDGRVSLTVSASDRPDVNVLYDPNEDGDLYAELQNWFHPRHTLICPVCGTEQEDDHIYCEECGTKLTGALRTAVTSRLPVLEEEEDSGSDHTMILIVLNILAALIVIWLFWLALTKGRSTAAAFQLLQYVNIV